MKHTNPHPPNPKIEKKFLGKVSVNEEAIDHYLLHKCLDQDSKISIAFYNLDDQRKKHLIDAILRRDARKVVSILCNSDVWKIIAARTNFTAGDLAAYFERAVQPGKEITTLEYAFLQKLLPVTPEAELVNSSMVLSDVARNIPDGILSGAEKVRIMAAISPLLGNYIDAVALDYTPTLPVLTPTQSTAKETVSLNELHAAQNAVDISEAILLTIGALKQAIKDDSSLKQLENAISEVEMNYAEGDYNAAYLKLEKILESPNLPEKTKQECTATLVKAENLSLEHSDTRRYWENKYAQYYLGMSPECMDAVNAIGKSMLGVEAESFSEIPKLIEIISNISDSKAHRESGDLKSSTSMFRHKRGQEPKERIEKREDELEKELTLPSRAEVSLYKYYAGDDVISPETVHVYVTAQQTLEIAFQSREGEIKRFPFSEKDIDPILFKEVKDYLLPGKKAKHRPIPISPPAEEKLTAIALFAQEKKGFPRFYGETMLSSHAGISKSTSPTYRTEITEAPTRNRKSDKYNASTDPTTYPHQHPGAPMVSSLSGHTFYIVALMINYLEKEGYSAESKKNVNLFLKAVAATYVLNGWHSLEEVMHVFSENNVQMYCAHQGFGLDASSFDPKAVELACKEAIPYAKTRCLLEATNKELKEAVAAGGQNLRHVEDIEKNYRELSDVLEKLEATNEPQEIIAMNDEQSALPNMHS